MGSHYRVVVAITSDSCGFKKEIITAYPIFILWNTPASPQFNPIEIIEDYWYKYISQFEVSSSYRG